MTAAPDRLKLVESFLNSVDMDSGRDCLHSLAGFRDWLADHGQTEAAGSATDADLDLARGVRDGLRDEIRRRQEGAPGGATDLDRLVARLPLRVRFDDSGTRLVPAATGVAGFLGGIVAAVFLAAHDGTFQRLKICREDSCRYVFYDRSKNCSRCWCSMDPCGNRNKTRAWRQRQRSRQSV
ncbi:MAG TPA: CGNR zinc finger domain-containing protein [Micromonosporaceae bacterium]